MRKIQLLCLTFALCLCIWACGQKEEEGRAENKAAAESGVGDSADIGDPEEAKASDADLEGNTVTNDIFSKADLTVVNFWATYCSPCINEMPELSEWSEAMPDNVQIIGVVTDVPSEDSDQYALAQQIAEKTGVNFVNLVAAEGFSTVIREIVGVPTTFFVDRDGNFVGSPVVGADVAGYKSFVEGYLDGLE